MNQRAFRRALRYGFGRAILHLQRHDAAPYRDDILDACLHDWTSKTHLHGRRAEYMFEIIELTGERTFYRDHILAAVASARGDLDGHHVFELARLFADAGDEASRDALDRALERLPFDYELGGHTVALHGSAGLARVVQLRLDRLDADGDARVEDEDVGHGFFALFGHEGDEAERDVLDRALERLPFDYWLAKVAIELHGPGGLARLMRLRLDRLDADGDVRAVDEIVGWWVIDDAYERWGKRAIAAAMRDAGRADPRIKTLWTDVRRRVAKGRQDWEGRLHSPPLTYEQVEQLLARTDLDPASEDGWDVGLYGWMWKAPDDEWRRLAAELAALPDDDPRWRWAVRSLYSRRAYPGDPKRLIATVRAARLDRFHYGPDQNDTEGLVLDTVHALADVTHPAVRSLALELLETPNWTSAGALLLAWNYVDGDLELLATVFRRDRSENRRHGIAHQILRIDETHAPADAPPVLLFLYEHVRCFECRQDLLARLRAHGALPAAIAAECCFDAESGVREYIAERVPGACTGSGG